jgi:hypothetical protein
MEIAVHPEIHTYSGGLGILAGDAARAAADLDLPMVFVTLMSRSGYLRQQLDAAGHQTDAPDPWYPQDFAQPLPTMVAVPIGGRQVWVRPWLYVLSRPTGGIAPILLLDTDVSENDSADRGIAGRLYGGDTELRLKQEIVLGIGGETVLRALGGYPMDVAERSYEPVTHTDLRRIVELVLGKLEDIYTHTVVAKLYRNRLLAMTLCQGSAQHYVDLRRGVKDLDVWLFFKAGLAKPFPYRARWTIDFGPSHLGRHPLDRGYEGRRIDLIGRSIAMHRGDTPGAAIARWLTNPGGSPSYIRQRPIIGLHPENLFAQRLWMPIPV